MTVPNRRFAAALEGSGYRICTPPVLPSGSFIFLSPFSSLWSCITYWNCLYIVSHKMNTASSTCFCATDDLLCPGPEPDMHNVWAETRRCKSKDPTSTFKKLTQEHPGGKYLDKALLHMVVAQLPQAANRLATYGFEDVGENISENCMFDKQSFSWLSWMTPKMF